MALIELREFMRGWTEDVISLPGYAETMALGGMSHSAFAGGRLLGIAGFMPQPAMPRAIGWALISRYATRRHYVAFTRKIREITERAVTVWPRLEIYVPVGEPLACYWADKLGFTRVDHPLRHYWPGPPGPRDAWLYERVADDNGEAA